MERNWLIVVLLLGVVALDAIVALATPRAGQENNLFFVLLTALCLSQVGMLGIWMVLGVQHWLLRWTMTAVVLFGWVRLLDYLAPPLSSEPWLVIKLLATVPLVFCFRLRNYRWRSGRDPSEFDTRNIAGRWQFSISTILRWTTLVAIVCARLELPEIFFLNEGSARWFFSDRAAMSILLSPLLATVTVWTFSAPSISWGRVAILLIAGVVPGILMRQPDMTLLGTVEAVCFLAWFSACQMAGYSIRREPSAKRPAEVAPADESLAPQ